MKRTAAVPHKSAKVVHTINDVSPLEGAGLTIMDAKQSSKEVHVNAPFGSKECKIINAMLQQLSYQLIEKGNFTTKT